MQLHQRACKVKTNTSTSLLTIRFILRLVETFEDALQLVFGNFLAIVADGNIGILIIVTDVDGNFSTSRCELESI